ncbi:MAG: hypothetical protein K2I96_04555, partial [Lachnospiraceae bacterium]|nr:hypothetical protein [Lachnospiraceae bacterium]
MEKRKYKIRPVNRLFIIWLFIILVMFAVITCSSSYIVQKENIMQQCEAVMQEVYELYDEKISSFSEIYVPIFASEDNERMIRSYFSRSGESIPDATERARLVSLLGEMLRQDEAVSFIALYNPDAVHNYCFTVNGNSLKDFWPGILEGNDESGRRMQLLGRYEWKDDNGNTRNAFMVKGGALGGNDGGCIIVGYNADIFDQIIRQDASEISAAFILVNENGVIYDSEGKRYVGDFQTEWLGEESAYHADTDHSVWFTGVIRNRGRGLTAAYIMPWWQIVKESNSVTWLILLVLVFFSFFALVLYLYSSRQIFLKVMQIQNGLAIIGSNELDYRLQVTDLNDEFDEIANNINAMTVRLKESIEREYQMRLKQNRAELNQIQARF